MKGRLGRFIAPIVLIALAATSMAADGQVSVRVNVIKGRKEAEPRMDPAISPDLAAALRREGGLNSFALVRKDQARANVGSTVDFAVKDDMSVQVKALKGRTAQEPYCSVGVSLYRMERGPGAGRKKVISEVTVKCPSGKQPFIQSVEDRDGAYFIAVYAE